MGGSIPAAQALGKRKTRRSRDADDAFAAGHDTLGNILCQILAGDFLQLNPVLNHSLMEIFGVEVPRAPTYERMDEQSRQRKQQIDRRGLQIFDRFLPQTILFRGSHRFKAGDPLAAILENMRKEGFHPLTPELKDLIRKQLFRPRANDPRLDSNFVMRDSDGRQVGPTGFFCQWNVFSNQLGSSGPPPADHCLRIGAEQLWCTCFPEHDGWSPATLCQTLSTCFGTLLPASVWPMFAECC